MMAWGGPRPPYFEEFVALWAFATGDRFARATLEMAEATLAGMTWDEYVANAKLHHDEGMAEQAWLEAQDHLVEREPD